MEYDEFLAQLFDEENPTKPKPTENKKKTADDIMAEFAPIVAADKQRGG